MQNVLQSYLSAFAANYAF